LKRANESYKNSYWSKTLKCHSLLKQEARHGKQRQKECEEAQAAKGKEGKEEIGNLI